MATGTAQIVVGTSHRFHGGIHPYVSLWLWENDRPVWQAERPDGQRVGWVPREPDTITLDGLLLVLAMSQDADSPVTRALEGMSAGTWAQESSELGDWPHYSQARVRELLRVGAPPAKVVVSALEGSTVLLQLPDLDVPWEMEVLTPIYSRITSPFSDGTPTVHGRLTGDGDGGR